MNYGGDAAEQVVRMSLEGVEVAARITGNGAKNIALLLAAVLKEEQKTKGKARLTNMLKSGKELKELRHELKLVKDIEARSPAMEEKLKEIEKERNIRLVANQSR